MHRRFKLRAATMRAAAGLLLVAGAQTGHARMQEAPIAPLPPASADDPVERLSRYLRLLADDPHSLVALTGAGRAALQVGDPSAAIGFFARAQDAAPGDGRVKAGLAAALVQLEQPKDALRYFDQAKGLGVPEAEFAADRGLAYDLRGDGRRAQADYRLALARGGASDETTRRLALSLAMSGDRAGALATLDPLLRRQDRAAWRASTFVLAMTGDSAGADARVAQLMTGPQAQAMRPFLDRLATLKPAEQAAAVHFGHFPSPDQRGGTRLAAAAPRPAADRPLLPGGLARATPAPVPDGGTTAAPALLSEAPAGPPAAAGPGFADLFAREAEPASRAARRRPGLTDEPARDALRTSAVPPIAERRAQGVTRPAAVATLPALASVAGEPGRGVSVAGATPGARADGGGQGRRGAGSAPPSGAAIGPRAQGVAPPATAVTLPALAAVAGEPGREASVAGAAPGARADGGGQERRGAGSVPPSIAGASASDARPAVLPAIPTDGGSTSAAVAPMAAANAPPVADAGTLSATTRTASVPPASPGVLSSARAPAAAPAIGAPAPAPRADDAIAPPSALAAASPPVTGLAAADTGPPSAAVPLSPAPEPAPALPGASVTPSTEEVPTAPDAAEARARASYGPPASLAAAVPGDASLPMPATVAPATVAPATVAPATVAPVTAARAAAPQPRPALADIAPPVPVPAAEAPVRPADAEAVAAPSREARSRASAAAHPRIEADATAPAAPPVRRRGAQAAAEPAPADAVASAKERAALARAAKLADAKAAEAKAKAARDAKAAKEAKAQAAEEARAAKEAKAKAAEEKRQARAAPERYWVQVAGGANKKDLPKAWEKARAAHPQELAGRSPHSTPLRFTNRLLIGPFKTADEAQAFVNRTSKAGWQTFPFTSPAGQKVESLPAK